MLEQESMFVIGNVKRNEYICVIYPGARAGSFQPSEVALNFFPFFNLKSSNTSKIHFFLRKQTIYSVLTWFYI